MRERLWRTACGSGIRSCLVVQPYPTGMAGVLRVLAQVAGTVYLRGGTVEELAAVKSVTSLALFAREALQASRSHRTPMQAHVWFSTAAAAGVSAIPQPARSLRSVLHALHGAAGRARPPVAAESARAERVPRRAERIPFFPV